MDIITDNTQPETTVTTPASATEATQETATTTEITKETTATATTIAETTTDVLSNPSLANDTRMSPASVECKIHVKSSQNLPVLVLNSGPAAKSDAGESRPAKDDHTSGPAPPNSSGAQLKIQADVSPQYGTFEEQQAENMEQKLLSEPNTDTVGTRDTFSIDMFSKSKPTDDEFYHRESSRLLNKAEVDHLCYDATEQVRDAPDKIYWWKALLGILFCPTCGLVSVFYALKSQRRYKKGETETAREMFRHSDFCFRLAIIFGLLLWFFCFMAFVVLKYEY
ncbi:hypothetical protein PoB_000651700 [Plakobranchus ocellatus]|uniref:Uncharacterized protein n=1 Tax=Plakobranchus ocellatus TaxID=259542 RepID=A0AAV3YAZ0_9GAST|nr:hypothetical protein PoB_000651700 [Plakobranchus ocellatus]